MAQATKLSQKELKQPDKFQSRGEQILQNLIDNRKRYLMYLGAFVLVVGLAFGGRAYWQHRQSAISQQFGDALEVYLAPIVTAADKEKNKETPEGLTFDSVEKKYMAALDKFKALVESQGGSSYGQFAMFYEANCFFKLKQMDKARELYEKFLAAAGTNFSDLRFVAEHNIAQTYDAENKLDKATEAYRKLYDDANGLFRDQALFMLAELSQRQGQKDEAVKLYNELIEKFPETALKAQAEKMLTVLGAPRPEPKLDAAKIEKPATGEDKSGK